MIGVTVAACRRKSQGCLIVFSKRKLFYKRNPTCSLAPAHAGNYAKRISTTLEPPVPP
jgi:hypothetical protein